MLNPYGFRLAIATMGEQFTWVKAMPCDCYDPRQNFDAQRGCDACDHGQVYESQGTCKGIVEAVKRDMLHPDLGWIQAGQLTLTTIQADVPFGKFDKVVLIQRAEIARETLSRGADDLGHTYPVAVIEVRDSTTIYVADTDYEFDDVNNKIVWLTAGPDNVYSVEYTHQPEYWHVGRDLQPAAPQPVAGYGLAIGKPTQSGLLSVTAPEG